VFPWIHTIGRDDCAGATGYKPVAAPRTIDWIVPANLFRLGAAHAEHSALVCDYGLL
jgi:hypothetical protein